MTRQHTLPIILSLLSAATLAFAGCSGTDGAAGTPGEKGEKGDQGSPAGGADGGAGSMSPSISAVVPGSAYMMRTANVTIAGFGTTWTSAAKVDFGKNVKVNKTTLASPTAIVANITIDKDADVGARDVTVTEGSSTTVYKGAFTVISPVDVTTTGTVAQGSIIVAKATQKDLTTLFDTTATGDGLFTPLVYTNIAATGGSGVTWDPVSVDPFVVQVQGYIDVTATAGVQALDVVSGPAPASGAADARVHNPAPKAIDVQARTATPLVAGAPLTGKVATEMQSFLYKFTPASANSLIGFTAISGSSAASPAVVILPKSGKFAQLLAYSGDFMQVMKSTDELYLIYIDTSGEKGYNFQLAATNYPFNNNITEGTSNETFATATSLTGLSSTTATLPTLVQGASLSTDTDADWYSFTLASTDTGKKLRVRTFPGDKQTNTLVEVFVASGTSTISVGGPSPNNTYHKNWLTPALSSTGAYYVKISAADQYDAASGTKYDAYFSLEQ